MEHEKLSPEEKELAESFERGEWRSVLDIEGEKRRYAEAARTTVRKDSRINIRISSKDLQAIQQRALEEGIPYQTLIAGILHKYVSGRLREGP